MIALPPSVRKVCEVYRQSSWYSSAVSSQPVIKQCVMAARGNIYPHHTDRGMGSELACSRRLQMEQRGRFPGKSD